MQAHKQRLALVALIFCGAAGAQTEVLSRRDTQPQVRARDAAEAILQFVGDYAVVDSRLNPRKIDAVTLTHSRGLSTLVLSSAGAVVAELQAGDCTGDMMHANTNATYLFCSNRNPQYRNPWFSFTRIVQEHTENFNVFTAQPMVVKEGVLVRYNLADGPSIARPLAVMPRQTR